MTRIKSIYGFQPLFVVFACKTAKLSPELQVSMGPRLRLWICAHKTACLAPELQVCMGPTPYRWICAKKTPRA